MKRVLGSLLAAALAFTLAPATTSPAHAADDGTITGVALGPDGKPLPNVGWELYTWEDGRWTTLQFGPKVTNSKGQFSYRTRVGGQYRVCFYDSYYGNAISSSGFWQPEIRHRDTCWPNATSLAGAKTWTATASAPSKTFTITLPKQGLGMAPVDPFIVGSYNVGDPLTIVGQEGWRPTNASFSYQWMSQADGAPAVAIPGATGARFTPTSAQSGSWIFARVTAARAGYKPATLTTAMSMVGTDHVQPTTPLKVTGTAKPGATLTASFGKPADIYHEISWFVDGVPQPDHTAYGDTPATFPVTNAHSGAKVEARLKLYKTDAQGNYVDGSDTFQRVQVQVSGSRPAVALRAAVAPAGKPTVGKVLKAPKITADTNATVRYQWLRGKKAIKGATKPRYKIRAVDLGKKLKVRMKLKRPGWWNTYVGTSKGAVAKRTLKKGTVKIKGKARVGKKLTASTAKWGPKPVKIRYQWLRGKKAIKGATKATYKVRKSDRDKKIKVRVTAKKPKFLTVSKTSKGVKAKR